VEQFAQVLDSEVNCWLTHAYAESTKRTYSSQFKAYSRFCRRLQVDPVPSDWSTLSRYVAFLARTKAPSTVRQYLNIIRTMHLIEDLPNPLEDNFKLDLLLRAIKRVRGDQPSYKLPLSLGHLLSIKPLLNLDSLRDCQLWAAMLVGFFGLLRVSNFTDVAKCVTREQISLIEGGLALNINASKTIQFRQRKHQAILPLLKNHPLCPVTALLTFFNRTLDVSDQAPLFSTMQNSQARPLSSSTFRRRLSDILTLANLSPAQYSTHSLRRGGATWLVSAGVPIQVVKRLGDWKSDAVFQYIRPQPSDLLANFPRPNV
jgi:hypothetical protein